MRPLHAVLIVPLAAVALAVSGVAVAGSLHNDPAARSDIASAKVHASALIADLEDAEANLTAPPPTVVTTVTETPAPVTTTATVTPAPVTTTATATVTAQPTAAATSTGTALPKYDPRGIPTGNAVLFGSAVGSNTNPDTREALFGGKLGLHRTYWRSDQVTSAVAAVNDDHADNRRPWVSFKLPVTWESAAAGGADAWAQDVAARLAATGKPVWVAIHHEPEGDGDLSAWKAVQRRLAPIFRAKPKIAYTVILTGWNQFYSTNQSYLMDNIWPGDGYFDVLGFDIYNNYGVVSSTGSTNTTFTELDTAYYSKIAPWAKAHGVKWAVAESGYTDSAAARDAAWLARAYDDMKARGGIGYAYFDSELNSQGSWALDTAAKQQAFAGVLARADKP